MFPVRGHLVKGQNGALNFLTVEAVQLFFNARENAGRAAGADELDFSGLGIGAS